jgi:hypothetical protein
MPPDRNDSPTPATGKKKRKRSKKSATKPKRKRNKTGDGEKSDTGEGRGIQEGEDEDEDEDGGEEGGSDDDDEEESEDEETKKQRKWAIRKVKGAHKTAMNKWRRHGGICPTYPQNEILKLRAKKKATGKQSVTIRPKPVCYFNFITMFFCLVAFYRYRELHQHQC